MYAQLAQMVEQLISNHQVGGSNPSLGTTIKRSMMNRYQSKLLPLDADTTLWILDQTNRALQSQADVQRSTQILADQGFASHFDKVKNWDNLVALYHASISVKLDQQVLDIGATYPESVFLPTLHQMGYENLFSINLGFGPEQIIHGVSYQEGDCTATNFPDNFFNLITCLSVIEHGVNVDKFLIESARILNSGGLLIVSTDYWQDLIDTGDRVAWNVPVKIFTQKELNVMVYRARTLGLHLVSPADLDCQDRVVNWIGLDYTFANLVFRKV